MEPARYRLVLRHPDRREELGEPRDARDGGPELGHSFTTGARGAEVSWTVVERRVAQDAAGAPLLELVAERDFAEEEGLEEELADEELRDRGIGP